MVLRSLRILLVEAGFAGCLLDPAEELDEQVGLAVGERLTDDSIDHRLQSGGELPEDLAPGGREYDL